MRTRPICPQALLFRLALLLVLLCLQHGALLHAYSHFGLVSDPYATGEGHGPPAQGCDLGVVHAALEGSPPSSAGLPAPIAPGSVPSLFSVTAATPLALRFFPTRAPPARA